MSVTIRFLSILFATIFHVCLKLFLIQASYFLYLFIFDLQNFSFFVNLLHKYLFSRFSGLWVTKPKLYIIHIPHKCFIFFIVLLGPTFFYLTDVERRPMSNFLDHSTFLRLISFIYSIKYPFFYTSIAYPPAYSSSPVILLQIRN